MAGIICRVNLSVGCMVITVLGLGVNRKGMAQHRTTDLVSSLKLYFSP